MPFEQLPPIKVPVLLLFHDGKCKVGQLYLDTPGFEDLYEAYQYWDDQEGSGYEWEWSDVVAWQNLPDVNQFFVKVNENISQKVEFSQDLSINRI